MRLLDINGITQYNEIIHEFVLHFVTAKRIRSSVKSTGI